MVGTDLTLADTDDMVAELCRRHDAVVVFAMRPAKTGDDAELIRWYSPGLTVAGALRLAADGISDALGDVIDQASKLTDEDDDDGTAYCA